MQVVNILLQVINGAMAFVTSQQQTDRIIKNSRGAVAVAFIPMVLGLIAAVIGTVIIFKKVKKGAQQIAENNDMLRGIKNNGKV